LVVERQAFSPDLAVFYLLEKIMAKRKMSRWSHFWQWWHQVHWAWKVLGLILLVLGIVFFIIFIFVIIYAVVMALVYVVGGGWVPNAIEQATNRR
jgi:ABC-type multidrug transport system permease subunit